MKTTLSALMIEELKDFKVFTLQTLYDLFPDEKKTTLRGRVYRELIGNGVVKKEGKGIYSFAGENGQNGVILNGDARDLSMLNNDSIELIVADHPYEIAQGTNRSYNSSYVDSTFEYRAADFQEKHRVLKDGGFLVEFLPEMKETNILYVMDVIKLALDNGFKFYAKVPWYKAEVRDGKLVDNSAFVGRKAVLEEVYIFSKGKPRALRSRKQGEKIQMEKGAAFMLPAVFMESPVQPSKRIHKAQKPETLMKKIIQAFTLEGETVLDQFAGSFVTFFSALSLKRRAVAIELNESFVHGLLTEK